MALESYALEAREPYTRVVSLVADLLFDCSRVLEYAKIRTVLQSINNLACRLATNEYLHLMGNCKRISLCTFFGLLRTCIA